jgi:uncharacterized membrane protein YkvA (DUF1232 family)
MTSELVPFPIDEDPVVRRRTSLQVVGEALLTLPNLVKLLGRLLADPRVPVRRKALLGFAIAYLASPVDLVPEALLPVVGQLDDLAVAVLAVHFLLRSVDAETLAEYWDGSRDALDLVTALVEWGTELVPRPLRRLLNP